MTDQLQQDHGGATVAYKGWVMTATGREAIEIVLPLGAPPALLDQAIEQWHQIRAAARAALQAEQIRPGDRVLTFGKYSGRTLADVFRADRGYLEWLSQAARDAEIRTAAGELLGGSGTAPTGQLDQAPAGQLDQAPDDAGDIPY